MNYLFLNSILTIQEVTSCVNEYALLYSKLRMFWYCHRCVLLSSTVGVKFWVINFYMFSSLFLQTLKGLVHDNAHVWVLTVADCFSTNRERVRCTQVQFTKFKLIVRDARVFPGIWVDFIYPHNSSLFFATPQTYVAADKNKIYSPVLLWNKHLPTCIFTRSYPR